MATSMNSASTCAGLNDISMFNGSDFESWRENLMIVFAFMDWDLPFREDCPTVNEESTSTEKKLKEKWDRSNRLCLMIMKRFIPEAFWGTNSDKTVTAKEFLENIEKRLVRSEKSEIATLLANLISMKYNIKGNIREYIMEMSNIASKLRALKLEISEDLLVHLVLISLPSPFEQFKMNYNSQKETWSLNELISHCVQEEEILKQNIISKKKAKKANKKRKREQEQKDEKEAAESTQKNPEDDKKSTEDTSCFFCGAVGHMKKQCHNYHAWLAKKGITEAKMQATGGTGCELRGNESKPLEKQLLMPSKKLKKEKQNELCDTCGNTKHLPNNCPLVASNTSMDLAFSPIEIVNSRVYAPKDDNPKGMIDDSNLYVASLPQSVHNNRLIELFRPFGKILESIVVMDANTGLSKGYGFVRYADCKSAANAVAGMNGTMIEGKKIAVRVAGSPPGKAPVHKPPKSDRSGPSGAMLNQPSYPISMGNSFVQRCSNTASETAPMAEFSKAVYPASQSAENPVVKKNKFIPVNAPDNVPVSTLPNSDRTGSSGTILNQPPFPISMVNSSFQPRYNSASETAPSRPHYPMSPGFSTAFCPASQSAANPFVKKSGIIPTAEDFANFPGYLKSFDDPKNSRHFVDMKPRER